MRKQARLLGRGEGKMFKPPPKHIFSMSLCIHSLYMSLCISYGSGLLKAG